MNFGERHFPLKCFIQPRTRFDMAVEQQAFMIITCDTAAQANAAAKRAVRLLPNYQRVALERMYDDRGTPP